MTETNNKQLQLRPDQTDREIIDMIRQWLASIDQDTSDTAVLREALRRWLFWHSKVERYFRA